MKRVCLFNSAQSTDKSIQRILANLRKRHGSLEALAERVHHSMDPGVEDLLDDFMIWRAAEKTMRERQPAARSNGRQVRERKT